MTNPAKSKPQGWQIVHRETDNPPEGFLTFELYSLEYCLEWLSTQGEDRGLWRLLPCMEGDVEEPTLCHDLGGWV